MYKTKRSNERQKTSENTHSYNKQTNSVKGNSHGISILHIAFRYLTNVTRSTAARMPVQRQPQRSDNRRL